MILRPGVHRYDRSRYPKSRLPGMAVLAFERELAGEADRTSTVRAPYDPHEAPTLRGETE